VTYSFNISIVVGLGQANHRRSCDFSI